MIKNEVIKKEELLISNDIDIKSMIYTIRGVQVMLDSDLARIYGYEVKYLNRQVRNNINKFPGDFMFRLTKEEVNSLRSQFVTSNKTWSDEDYSRCKKCTLNEEQENEDCSRSQIATLNTGRGSNIKYLPYAFTEQGVYMLATVLKGELATLQSIYIIRSFKLLRHMYVDNNLLLDRIISNEVKLIDHDNKLDEVFNYISDHKEVKEKIFYKGQVYEAFSFISDLIAKANKSLILIDNYIDIKTLNLLSKKKSDVDITIYTSNNKLTTLDINTFNNEYPSISIIKTNKYHDRFLILDKKIIYLIGASIKDAGNKTFAIVEMDKRNINELLTRQY